MIDDDIHPNGMAFSADGALLYAADTFRRRLVVYAAGPDRSGVPERKAEISTRDVRGLPDGLVTDEEGFVWVAFYQGSCVARFAPDGGLAEVLDVPVRKTLSLCFGGRDRSDLYIVTGRGEPGSDETGSIFVVSAGVRGTTIAPVMI